MTKAPPVQKPQRSKRIRIATPLPRNASSRPKNSVSERLGPYVVGERLIVTNNYLKAKGTEGIVLALKRKYTMIQENEGNLHERAHSNYN